MLLIYMQKIIVEDNENNRAQKFNLIQVQLIHSLPFVKKKTKNGTLPNF